MGLLQGIRCFADGFATALDRKHRHFVYLPAGLSLLIISVGLWIGFTYVTDLADYLVSLLPGWLSFLEWILAPLLYLIGMLAGAWLFGFLAAIIGAPFLGELTLRVDGAALQDIPWWHQIWPTLRRELRKLRYHLPRLAALLLLGLVPVVNAIAPAVWLAFGAWMMAVQFCDFYYENRGQDFLDTLDTLRANRSAALGFGVCAAFALSIPVLNFVAAPVAAVGATLLMKQIADPA